MRGALLSVAARCSLALGIVFAVSGALAPEVESRLIGTLVGATLCAVGGALVLAREAGR